MDDCQQLPPGNAVVVFCLCQHLAPKSYHFLLPILDLREEGPNSLITGVRIQSLLGSVDGKGSGLVPKYPWDLGMLSLAPHSTGKVCSSLSI